MTEFLAAAHLAEHHDAALTRHVAVKDDEIRRSPQQRPQHLRTILDPTDRVPRVHQRTAGDRAGNLLVLGQNDPTH
jgi:hypothetical protein